MSSCPPDFGNYVGSAFFAKKLKKFFFTVSPFALDQLLCAEVILVSRSSLAVLPSK